MKMTKTQSVKVELAQGSIEITSSGDHLEIVMTEAHQQGSPLQRVTFRIDRKDMAAARAGLTELIKALTKAINVTGPVMTQHYTER